MSRLRYTLDEARAEAERLAKSYVTNLSGCETLELFGSNPLLSAPRSNASKHPVQWLVSFRDPPPPDAVVDGGELILDVNVESKSVAIWGV
jgi:hypothetical protein